MLRLALLGRPARVEQVASPTAPLPTGAASLGRPPRTPERRLRRAEARGGAPRARLLPPQRWVLLLCPPPGLADALSGKMPAMPACLVGPVSAYLDAVEKHRRLAQAAERELAGMEALGSQR